MRRGGGFPLSKNYRAFAFWSQLEKNTGVLSPTPPPQRSASVKKSFFFCKSSLYTFKLLLYAEIYKENMLLGHQIGKHCKNLEFELLTVRLPTLTIQQTTRCVSELTQCEESGFSSFASRSNRNGSQAIQVRSSVQRILPFAFSIICESSSAKPKVWGLII